MVKVKVKFTPEQEHKAHIGLGARWGWVADVTSRPLYPRERNTVLILQGASMPQSRPGRFRKISP
jgi:hypothetical protein